MSFEWKRLQATAGTAGSGRSPGHQRGTWRCSHLPCCWEQSMEAHCRSNGPCHERRWVPSQWFSAVSTRHRVGFWHFPIPLTRQDKVFPCKPRKKDGAVNESILSIYLKSGWNPADLIPRAAFVAARIVSPIVSGRNGLHADHIGRVQSSLNTCAPCHDPQSTTDPDLRITRPQLNCCRNFLPPRCTQTDLPSFHSQGPATQPPPHHGPTHASMSRKRL